MKIHLQPEIFALAPDFHRGLVIARHLNNNGYSSELEARLREAESETKKIDSLGKLCAVTGWDEVHRAFGSNPNKFPPAHKNLLKRVNKPEVRLPFISKVVAIMNTSSLSLRTPVGGDDLKRCQDFGADLELRLARGNETFLPLGKDVKEETPEENEVIYAVGDTIMCRRWNWRNSCQTLITSETTEIVMNIDCLGEGASEQAQVGAAMVAALLREFCGASVKEYVLSASEPSLQL